MLHVMNETRKWVTEFISILTQRLTRYFEGVAIFLTSFNFDSQMEVLFAMYDVIFLLIL